MKQYRFKVTLGSSQLYIRATNFDQLLTQTSEKFKLQLGETAPKISYLDVTINSVITMENQNDFEDIVANAPNIACIELTIQPDANLDPWVARSFTIEESAPSERFSEKTFKKQSEEQLMSQLPTNIAIGT